MSNRRKGALGGDDPGSPGSSLAAGAKASAGEVVIRLEGIVKEFDGVRALDNVDLEVRRGEVMCVIGYSGAGKSTLVRLLNGLERPTAGRVWVNDTDLTRLKESKLRSVRRDIGMIFQQFNLMNSRTISKNIAYPLEVAGWSKSKRAARVKELLDFVGLADKGDQYPDQLSGGQKQRVGIARALATDPSLLLADEATSALDPDTTAEVLELLRKVKDELGTTIVVITHEMDVVHTLADRVTVMAQGKVVETGSVFTVFAHPTAETTQRFVATQLRDNPDEHLRKELLTDVPEADSVYSVALDEGTTVAGVLGRASEFGVRFEVLHGGVSRLQQRSFGRLTLRVGGTSEARSAFLSALRSSASVEEIRQ